MSAFEFDPAKQKKNLRVHKIGLDVGARIFEGFTIEAEDDRFDYGEERLGRGLKPGPEAGGGDEGGGEVVPGELVIAGRDPSKVLELVKEALDQIALSVEFVLDGSLDLAVPLGRDVCLSAGLGDKIDDCLRVIATVSDEGFGCG